MLGSAGHGRLSAATRADLAQAAAVALLGDQAGRRASVRIACLYEFEEDRLVCERVWFDFATIMRQLGVLTS